MPEHSEAAAPDGREKSGLATVMEFDVAWEETGRKDRADIPVSVQVKGDERSYMGRL
jgi:hypothetical protein